MPGVFPYFMAPEVRNNGIRELAMLRWGMPGPPQFGGAPITNIRNAKSANIGAHGSRQRTGVSSLYVFL